MILADSNILIDIISKDPVWFAWSKAQLDGRHPDEITINQMVVAEVAPRFGSLELFAATLQALDIGFDEFGNEAAFAAGMAFSGYRRNRGVDAPKLALPDFFIGGHAQTLGATIVTRDPRFYRAYFPDVSLITPSKDDA